MDNDHHGVPHGPNLPKKIGPRHDPRSFSWYPWYVGGKDPSSVSLLSLFIVVFSPLNGVPRVDICPNSLSLQLLGVVVRTEKYGSVWHKTPNAIVSAFPLDASVFSVVFFCFSAFPTPWNNMECRCWWYVASFTLGYISAEEDFPMAEEGFSLG